MQGVLAPLQFVVFLVSLGLVIRFLVTGEGELAASTSIVVKTLVLYTIMITGSIWDDDNEDGVILGEAHTWGTVVLSWDSVTQGLADPRDGHDTATHEFAHVLDIADGRFDGTPVLSGHGRYAPWARVMTRHFERLRKGRRPEGRVLRDYGATNEAEFFAVATEAFFEKPEQMKAKTPELYEELRQFYGWDPAA